MNIFVRKVIKKFVIKDYKSGWDNKLKILVAPARLILIESIGRDAIGLMRRKDTGKLMFAPMSEEDHKQAQYFNPILVSNTEEIETNDMCYFPEVNKIDAYNNNILYGLTVMKILAFPENFTNAHIKAIAFGNLRENEDLFIECVGAILKENEKGEKYISLNDGKVNGSGGILYMDTINSVKFEHERINIISKELLQDK